VQQPLGTERPCCEHDLVGGDDAAPRAPVAAAHGDQVTGAARRRPYPGDRRELMHRDAEPLGEVQVVLHEGVLGVVPAAGHAGATVDAAVTRRAGAAEVRVDARRPPVDPDPGRPEGPLDPHPGGDPAHHLVRAGQPRIGGHPEHPLGRVVVPGQLGVPSGDAAPLRIGEERGRRPVERVRVDQRAAADPGTGQHEHVAQQVDPLNAVAADRRRPQEPSEIPRGAGQFVVGEPPPGLEDGDRVPLLGEAQRGDTAAEAGPDHYHVVARANVHEARPPTAGGRRRSAAKYVTESSVMCHGIDAL
jgi:hypothetical protein